MIKKLIVLTFILFFQIGLNANEIDWENFNLVEDCPQGICIEPLVTELQTLSVEAEEQGCMPSGDVPEEEIKTFFLNTALSLECVNKITRLQVISERLDLIDSQYESLKTSAANGCFDESDSIIDPEFLALLKGGSTDNMCTEEKAAEVSASCGEDVQCALVSSATATLGPVIKLMGMSETVNQWLPGDNCDVSDDNCLARAAAGFLKATVSFLTGTWDLLKMGGAWVKDKVISGWNALWGVEDQSSNAALAAAEASTDEGVFDMLRNDFTGTISNLWSGLVGMIKQWLTHDVYCEKWSGQPHFSECLEPYPGFDCMSCKAMINGTCNAIGAVLAEVVPAFLTGGVVTAAKYGAKGAVALARLTKMSDATRAALKATRLDKAARATSKVASSISRGIGKGWGAGINRLKGLGKAPWFLATKAKLGIVGTLAAQSTRYVVGKTWKGVVFGGKALKTVGKVVIYPIENPLTVNAFKLGMRSVDSLASLGSKGAKVGGGLKLLVKSDSALAAADEVDQAFVNYNRAELAVEDSYRLRAQNPGSYNIEEQRRIIQNYEQARATYQQTVKARRGNLFDEVVANSNGKPDLDKIIDELYPELNYSSEFAKGAPKQSIQAAEAELNALISRIDDPKVAQELRISFTDHKASPGRLELNLDNKKFYTRDEVIRNSELGANERFTRALEEAGINPQSLQPEELAKLRQSLLKAHEIDTTKAGSVYNYSSKDIYLKSRTLVDGGFTKEQASRLIRSGLAGDPPFSDDIFVNLNRMAVENPIKSPTEYNQFLKTYKDKIDKAVKADARAIEDFEPQQFATVRTEKGKEFYLLRSSSDPAKWKVFTKDGKGFSMFKGSETTLENLPSKYGEEFLLDNGTLVTSMKTPRGHYFDVKDGMAAADFDYDDFFKVLRANASDFNKVDFPKAKFDEFLNTHENTLREMMKNGKIRPNDIRMDDFVIATNADTGEAYYLFKGYPPSNSILFSVDGKVIKESGSVTATLEEFASSKQKVLRYSDGKGYRFALTPKGMHTQTLPLLRKSKDEVRVVLDRLEASTAKVKVDNYEEYAQLMGQHKDGLVDLLYKGDVQLNMIGPRSQSSFVGSDGKKYWVFKNGRTDPEDFLVLSADGSTIGSGGAAYTKLRNFKKVSNDVIEFADGTKVHFWKSYHGDNIEYVDTLARTAQQNLDDIVRRYDFVDSNNLRVNREFVDFVRNNEKTLVKFVERKRLRIDEINPDNLLKYEKNGEVYYALASNDRTKIYSMSARDLGKDSYLQPITLKPNKVGDEITFSNGEKVKISYSDEQRRVVEVVENQQLAELRVADQIKNSHASVDEKFAKALEDLKIDPATLNETQLNRLKLSLAQANDIGRTSGKGLFSYTDDELAIMRNRLMEGGFDQRQADYLVDSGIAARPPTRVYQDSTGYFADTFSDLTRMSYSEKRDLLRSNLLSKYSRTVAAVEQEGGGLLARIKKAVGAANPTAGKATIDTKDAQQILDNVDALYFIDYKHSSRGLFDVASGNTQLHKTNFSSRYDRGGLHPFENYSKANKWLMDENPEMSLDTFRKIHTHMMEGGVDGISAARIGKTRDVGVIGNVSTPVSKDILLEVKKNPYLGFDVKRYHDDGQKISGQILYANYNTLNEEGLRRLSLLNPEMADDIKRLGPMTENMRALNGQLDEIDGKIDIFNNRIPTEQKVIDDLKSIQETRPLLPDEVERLLAAEANLNSLKKTLPSMIKTLEDEAKVIEANLKAIRTQHTNLQNNLANRQNELVEALTEERIRWFNQQRQKIGPLNSPEKLDEFTDTLAEFQRDIISIHPFADGNGRSTRQFALYYPLMREGFPPPRILNPDNDLFTPLDIWAKEIKDGIIASNELIDDLTVRAQVGLPLENSPDLIAPMRRDPIELDMIRDNKKNPMVPSGQTERIDDGQYAVFVRKVIDEDPTLASRMETNPTTAWEEVHEKALARYKENNAYYDYRRYKGKERVERLQLGVADEDFRALYGHSSYEDPVKYAYKMDTWYQEQVNWRGLATLQGRTPKSEAELVGMFKELSPHMTSNHILGARTADPAKIRELAIDNINTYEKAMAHRGEGDLAEVAKWHSEAVAPHYGRSIGYSTSQDRKVGKAFAMGAMVVADYGKHWDHQEKIAQRVLVGARRSVKDVDLMRLKKLREDFSYKYYRQKEVMGIGAADPDSVMIIQVLDETGTSATTYLRDPERPWRIQVIKGEAEVGEALELGDSRLERVIDLRD
ncbi:MAG: hypothetical protein GY909_11120 [Oligoflexia bacterium]|nr:hypothetical protein [Oligoflexia bacterium]